MFLSDNGYLLGQHGRAEKNCFYEPALRVPLIVRWPGHLPRNKRVPRDGRTRRSLPDRLQSAQGSRATDLARDGPGSPDRGPTGAKGRDVVFSEYNESEEAMVRSDRFKLIVGTGRRQRKDHLEIRSAALGPLPDLFDLKRDPEETINLSGAAQLTRFATSCCTSCTSAWFPPGWGPSRFPRASPSWKRFTGA